MIHHSQTRLTPSLCLVHYYLCLDVIIHDGSKPHLPGSASGEHAVSIAKHTVTDIRGFNKGTKPHTIGDSGELHVDQCSYYYVLVRDSRHSD